MCKKKLLNLLGRVLVLSILLFAKPYIRKTTGGFTIGKILCPYAADTAWSHQEGISSDELRKILKQKFYYLGKGHQCYVFSSENQEYVIKFFNQSRYKKSPSSRDRNFINHLLGLKELREESGLVAVHFCSEELLTQIIVLVDALGIHHSVDLDQIEFVLQKRMQMPFDVIDAAMDRGDEPLAKHLISQLFAFVKRRLDKNIIDHDTKLYTNLGILNGKACQLDVGQIRKATCPEDFHQDFIDFKIKNRRSYRWIKERYPCLLPYYVSELESLEKYYNNKSDLFKESK